MVCPPSVPSVLPTMEGITNVIVFFCQVEVSATVCGPIPDISDDTVTEQYIVYNENASAIGETEKYNHQLIHK